ncbi:PEP-utilizing enzyme [Streptosporangium canum]|uniref:PEP-utilizing enzyme n=1 Tax=Streptosporangium canum TaxID=324952 RepID=UPI003415EA48
MNTKVAVIAPGSEDTSAPWTDRGRLTLLLESIFSEIGAEAICFFDGTAAGWEFPLSGFRSAVCIPPGTVPFPSVAEALVESPGVRMWTSTGPLESAPIGVSFGETALEALNACRHLPYRSITARPGLLARHLVAGHAVPTAQPQRGLAVLHDPWQRSRVLLGGKDVTLRRLVPLLRGSRIDPGLSIDWGIWSTEPNEARERLARFSGRDAVIIRSCGEGEDGWEQSHAGVYASVVVAPDTDPTSAIDQVFRSYPAVRRRSRVFVQRWLDPVDAACVITTRTLGGAPYYTVAVDDVSGRSDQITSGAGSTADVRYVHRKHWSDGGRARIPEAHRRFIAASAEVEQVTGSASLDLELAVAGGAVHLLQVRPLVAARTGETDAGDSYALIEREMRRLRELGDGLLLSNMADWNPAEMIGRRPSPLAVSLYRTLITDSTWARQRAECGYTDLRGTPLMQVVAGSPYIDVLTCLTSFLPAALPREDARIVVRAQCDRLRSEPELHDKIEFAVAMTCWTPDADERLAQLGGEGVPDGSLRRLCESLMTVTRRIIDGFGGHVGALAACTSPTDLDAHPDRLDETLGAARRIALVFAHLARAAFVAVDLLRALEELELAENREAWMRSVGTVATGLQRDAAAVNDGTLTWASFVERHQWTRPGTYDPTVPTYGQRAEEYLSPLLRQPFPAYRSRTPASPLVSDAMAVSKALAPLGLDAARAEVFFREAIRAREAGKAMYAAWVSAALESAVARAARSHLSRSDLTYLEVAEISADPTACASLVVSRREEARRQEALLELPDVITCPEDLLSFTRAPGRPSFIGSKNATGQVHLNPTASCPPPSGAVVLIESADPGYDWVLSLGISALVTAYGGTNSHMAIRCAELGISAAIGIGLQRFEFCKSAKWIGVDARARRLIVSS